MDYFIYRLNKIFFIGYIKWSQYRLKLYVRVAHTIYILVLRVHLERSTEFRDILHIVYGMKCSKERLSRCSCTDPHSNVIFLKIILLYNKFKLY